MYKKGLTFVTCSNIELLISWKALLSMTIMVVSLFFQTLTKWEWLLDEVGAGGQQ